MKVILLQIRARADIDDPEYQRAFEHMLELGVHDAGFRGVEGFAVRTAANSQWHGSTPRRH